MSCSIAVLNSGLITRRLDNGPAFQRIGVFRVQKAVPVFQRLDGRRQWKQFAAALANTQREKATAHGIEVSFPVPVEQAGHQGLGLDGRQRLGGLKQLGL